MQVILLIIYSYPILEWTIGFEQGLSTQPANVQCNSNNFRYKNACLTTAGHSFFSKSVSVTSTGCCRLFNSPFRHKVISWKEEDKNSLVVEIHIYDLFIKSFGIYCHLFKVQYGHSLKWKS